jgi:hippurate hydrolase
MPTPSLFDALRAHHDSFVRLRRDLHQHPELGFEERRTSDVVASALEGWGYRVERGIAVTGLVAQLRRGSGTRRLGLRADMDALPIHETTGLPHASVHAGVMHACGHDGHTAMLLAAARLIAEQIDFSGTLNLIFQPAEEGQGGAARMIAEGLFERYPCDAVFAMHNYPGAPTGQLLFRDGPTMASSDTATITLRGRGGHGALPHRAADPVVAAASLVLALQTIVSRNVDPQAAAVVTVGALHAGAAPNVIAETATLQLSIRSLDSEVRDMLEARIRALVDAHCAGFGMTAELDYQRSYPVLCNSHAETDIARAVALELVGEQGMVRQVPAVTGSEDFAFMLQRCPGSYLFIGNGDGQRGSPCMIHNPGYDFDDDNLITGAAFWAALVRRCLPEDTRN